MIVRRDSECGPAFYGVFSPSLSTVFLCHDNSHGLVPDALLSCLCLQHSHSTGTLVCAFAIEKCHQKPAGDKLGEHSQGQLAQQGRAFKQVELSPDNIETSLSRG